MHYRVSSVSRLWSSNHKQEGVRAFQEGQLKRLVAHAYARVPYYTELFDRHGLHPRDIRSLDDLSAIPISEKKDLQEAGFSARVAEGTDPGRLFVRWTSGSTAQPMQICCTWLEESLLSCLRARALWPLGVKPWKSTVRLKIISSTRRAPSWLTTVQWIGFYRQVGIDCLLPPQEILIQLARANPDILISFPTILGQIAELGNQPALSRLNTVIVGGESSTPLLRRRIEVALGVRVFDTYGSHEFNQIAVECPRSGLLDVCGWITLVEILKDGRPAAPGEEGEVVATALHSFAMPFIRYRLGDVAIKGPETCACGASSGTIRAVAGRMADYLLLKDGQKVHPFRVILGLSHDFEWIRQYQLIQKSLEEIQVRFVPARKPSDSEINELRRRIGQTLEDKARVILEVADHIPIGPHGKFKVCDSRLLTG